MPRAGNGERRSRVGSQTPQQTLDVLPGQLVGLTGDLNGPRAEKEWAAVPAPMQAKAK
ncbi:hypothetical protein FBZ94_102280 [Bradyrhizobium sacchari]|uniref:Uncharacterized protein n=1 Tax=Bradyrhizobium sacchari TaxID=1399419 RepID=A0A560J2T1_9BRAD|nr:hypothetical protein FBZ94_102280 [Bradyrhizobium sacchari]TWB81063.1 hypothetical protein FBZ95_102281 [Bradyrhizobium sacchari]